MPVPCCSTMKLIAVHITTSSGPVILLNIYRPGSERPTSLFFDELSAALESVMINACPVLVGGDFNIHVQDDKDPHARRLNQLIKSFDMMQHVHGPTHRAGQTLDLVLKFSACQLQSVTAAPPGVISDHSLVDCLKLCQSDGCAAGEKSTAVDYVAY